MYLKLQDNSIKYRISKEEAISLSQGKELIQQSPLHSDIALTYSVKTIKTQNEFVFIENEFRFQLYINHQELKQQLQGSPTKKGIVFQQDKMVKQIVSLEIDLKRNSKPY